MGGISSNKGWPEILLGDFLLGRELILKNDYKEWFWPLEPLNPTSCKYCILLDIECLECVKKSFCLLSM